MEPQVLRIGDLDVHVTVSDRRRTVRLTLERDATVTAVIPPSTDEGSYRSCSSTSQRTPPSVSAVAASSCAETARTTRRAI